MFEHKTYMHSMTCAILPCPKCGKNFETKRAFQKHTTALHRDLVCNKCPKKLGSSRSLREHKKRTHVPVNLEPQQVVGGALGENTSQQLHDHQSESLAKILDFLVVSGRDECMSHLGTIKIQVLHVLSLYLPAIFDFCVVRKLLGGQKMRKCFKFAKTNLKICQK